MKYIKTYEIISNNTGQISPKPKIGDWVILKLDGIVHTNRKTGELKKHALFMNNRVGQITDMKSPQIYEVNFYEHIPGMSENQTNWFVTIEQIKMFSQDKEKLEAILAADKYNL